MRHNVLFLVILLAGCQSISASIVEPMPVGGTALPVAVAVTGPNAGPGTSGPAIATVSLAPPYLTLAPGGSQTLVPVVKMRDGQLNQNVFWSSSDSTIADVNPTTGSVHALKEGWVTIVAAYALDPAIKGLATVHVVKDLKIQEASRSGVKLKYPSYWKLNEVDSEQPTIKTIFTLTKDGPSGSVATLDVRVANGGYFESFVAALKLKTAATATIVAGNKDGIGASSETMKDGNSFNGVTWVVNSSGYAYVITTSMLASSEAFLETRDEINAVLDGLIFSSPSSPLDLAPPPSGVDGKPIGGDSGSGGLSAQLPESVLIPNLTPAWPGNTPTPGPTQQPITLPSVVVQSPTPVVPTPTSKPSSPPVFAAPASPQPTPAATTTGTRLETYAVASDPYAIAIDGAGNVWVAHNSGSVTKLSPAGATLGTYAVGSVPHGIAIDGVGNVWVAHNSPSNNVTKLSPAGVTLGTFAAGSYPHGIAIDAAGNVWVANISPDNNVTKLSPTGATLGTFAVGTNPEAVAIDASGNVWVANRGDDTVTKLSPTGATFGTFAVGSNPKGIAFDDVGNAWVTNNGSNSVTKFSPAGATLGTFAVGIRPHGIAIDASGNAWVTDSSGSGSVTKLSPAGATLGTFAVGSYPVGIAIDASGNAWVANLGDDTVTKLGK